jgi:anti-sigma factor RsiW
MNAATHPVAPEEVMAFLDGELTSAEAQAVSSHLDQCAECAGLAAQLRSTSQSLSGWTVPAVPASLEETVLAEAAEAADKLKQEKPGRTTQLSLWNWRLWAVAGGGALTVVLIGVALVASIIYPGNLAKSRPMEMAVQKPAAPDYFYTPARAQNQQTAVMKGNFSAAGAGVAQLGSLATPPPPPPVAGKTAGGLMYGYSAQPGAVTAPMIARTVSLTIAVKDFAAVRASLDSILVRHRGYAAQLSAATAENAPRTLQASLRIPAPELAAALAELKGLGRVESETQAGDEVTQQHTDLAARIQNSRETEERMRAILEQRTGKIEDVLQVEEEIARVRGEIESMEADQQALEHRVDFASVDLQIAEEYKAALNPPSASVSNRIHNAFVGGLRSAAEMLLGCVLFVEESGPVLLIWLAILGMPIFLLWRRYRSVMARF